MKSHLALVCTVSFLFAAGCSAAGTESVDEKEPSTNQRPTETTSGSTSGNGNTGSTGQTGTGNTGSSNGGQAASTSDAGSGGTGTQCIDVSGRWEGVVSGKYKGDPNGTTENLPVEGAVNIKFAASTNGKSTIEAGSEFNVTLKNMPSIIPGGPPADIPVKQALTGTADCGVLKANAKGNAIIFEVTGDATCTFTNTECKNGTWKAFGLGAQVASGTFTLARRQ